jgi:hypothetical protein
MSEAWVCCVRYLPTCIKWEAALWVKASHASRHCNPMRVIRRVFSALVGLVNIWNFSFLINKKQWSSCYRSISCKYCYLVLQINNMTINITTLYVATDTKKYFNCTNCLLQRNITRATKSTFAIWYFPYICRWTLVLEAMLLRLLIENIKKLAPPKEAIIQKSTLAHGCRCTHCLESIFQNIVKLYLAVHLDILCSLIKFREKKDIFCGLYKKTIYGALKLLFW